MLTHVVLDIYQPAESVQENILGLVIQKELV